MRGKRTNYETVPMKDPDRCLRTFEKGPPSLTVASANQSLVCSQSLDAAEFRPLLFEGAFRFAGGESVGHRDVPGLFLVLEI